MHKSLKTVLAGTACFASMLGAQAHAQEARVFTLGEYSLIEEAQSRFLRESIAGAAIDGATSVVLRIDSPAGLAWETKLLIETIAAVEIPVVAWIEKRALGAGALVALACDQIYVNEGAALGGEIEGVEWRGPRDDLPRRLTDRKFADVIDEVIAVVGANVSTPEVARGFIDEGTSVSVDDMVLSGVEDFLRLSDLKEMMAAVKTVKGRATSVADVAAKASLGNTEAVPFVKEKKEEGEPEPAAPDNAASKGATTKVPETEEADDEDFGKTKLESYKDQIVVIEVQDDTLIRSTKFEFMERVLKKASEDGAEAVILDMNTPGGLAWHTVDIMMDALAKVEVPTYTYVNPAAASAGALIAVATDHIYMHRPSSIGVAGVVSSVGEIEGTAKEKITRYVMAAARGTAGTKGHAQDVAMAFIDPEIEVVRDLPMITPEGSLEIFTSVVNPKGEMLALDADQATQLFDGIPVLAKGIAKDLDDLIAQEGLEGDIVRARPLGFENVADLIVKLAPFLLLLGLAGAWVELKTPGFGVAGAISLACFALFFFGHNLAGKLAGYELFGVFLLGVILLIVEIFVFPGLFLFGIAGFLLMIGSLVFAMVDKFDWSTEGGGIDFGRLMDGLSTPLFNMSLALIGSIFLVVILIRYLPETRAMKWLMLDTAIDSGTGLRFAGPSGETQEVLLGRAGEAQTDLRPAGKANFDGVGLLDVITSGEFVAKGARIEIVEQEGARIVVEEC